MSFPAYSPFSDFDPPADLPDDLKEVFQRAAAPVQIAVGFCSFPNRFDYSPQQLSAWFDPLRERNNELADWIVGHEAELRAEAPEVFLAIQGILEVLGPLVHLQGGG